MIYVALQIKGGVVYYNDLKNLRTKPIIELDLPIMMIHLRAREHTHTHTHTITILQYSFHTLWRGKKQSTIVVCPSGLILVK